jgi:hypothetical protein
MWNITVGTVTLIAGGFAFIVYRLQRRDARKELSFEYTAVRLQDFNELHSKLTLTFEGKPVYNVFVVTVRIRNSGRMPIRREDFEKELFVEFQADNVLSINVMSACKPADLRVDVQLERQRFGSIVPLLLNQDDEISLLSVVSGFRGIEIHGRIAGVGSIDRKTAKDKLPRFVLLGFAAGACTSAGAVYGLWARLLNQYKLNLLTPRSPFELAAVAIGVVLALIALIAWKLDKDKNRGDSR